MAHSTTWVDIITIFWPSNHVGFTIFQGFSSSLMYPQMGFGWVFVGQLWSIHPSIFWSKASRHIAQILRVSPTCSASSSASVACLPHLRPQPWRFPLHPCQMYGSIWKLKVYMIDPNIINDIQDHASLLLWRIVQIFRYSEHPTGEKLGLFGDHGGASDMKHSDVTTISKAMQRQKKSIYGSKTEYAVANSWHVLYCCDCSTLLPIINNYKSTKNWSGDMLWYIQNMQHIKCHTLVCFLNLLTPKSCQQIQSVANPCKSTINSPYVGPSRIN